MVAMEEFMKRQRAPVKNGSHLVKVAIFLHGRFTFQAAAAARGAGQSPLAFLLPAHLPRPLVGIAIVG